MKIGTKLAINDMKKNKKRTLYTTISLILCTTLILTTILLISSIRNGVSKNFDTEYNDYHIILKDLSVERFNKIKTKTYINKIYIQKGEDSPLEKVDLSYTPIENTTVYLKYKDIKKVCEYTNDILRELELTELEFKNINDNCKFNKKLLTVHGYIDLHIAEQNNIPTCLMRVNYSPIITLMIITLILVFSALFIIILYNAFLITINERKKEYAILNSVGGTEGQVLKMVFTEAILIGIIGILIGGVLSVFLTNIVLSNINNILNRAGYYFNLTFDIKHIILSLVIIVINIYLSVLIPSVKASSTSVIQGIRNNKEVKNNKRETILEKLLPIEGKVAIKNIKRNKSKYKLIIFLLVICITSFISISTYIIYEKETSDLVSEYDVDAEFSIDEEDNINYKSILKDYERLYRSKLEYMEYTIVGATFLVEPPESIMETFFLSDTHEYEDNKRTITMKVIGLDDKTYSKYIEEINAEEGDNIIYNIVKIYTDLIETKYKYSQIFKKEDNIKLSLARTKHIYDASNNLIEAKIISTLDIGGKSHFTDKLVEGYQEIKTVNDIATIFVDMETFKKITTFINETEYESSLIIDNNIGRYIRIKIKCDDIVKFKNYMEKFEENGIYVQYYTLDNQEKIMYIDIVELILKVMMIAIITIGIVSTVNIMNASLIERKEDFNILYRMGATKGNVKKILIYECIYMFLKALVISIILSIPIIYKIIKGMEKVLVLNKLLIPFGSIGIFIAIIFVISLIITLFSTRMIKEE